MRWILWGAVAAGLILGGAMGASAQGMGGMGGSMAADTKPRAAKPAPRAKRHYYRSSRKGAVAGSCGLHKYWSKGACKDARTHPPSLK